MAPFEQKAKGTDAARKQASESMKTFFSDPENRLKRSVAMKGQLHFLEEGYCSFIWLPLFSLYVLKLSLLLSRSEILLQCLWGRRAQKTLLPNTSEEFRRVAAEVSLLRGKRSQSSNMWGTKVK